MDDGIKDCSIRERDVFGFCWRRWRIVCHDDDDVREPLQKSVQQQSSVRSCAARKNGWTQFQSNENRNVLMEKVNCILHHVRTLDADSKAKATTCFRNFV